MKVVETIESSLAAATPGGLYPSVEEVRLLCGTPDFTLYSQLLEHAPALIGAAKALEDTFEWIKTGMVDGVGFDETQVIEHIQGALEKFK